MLLPLLSAILGILAFSPANLYFLGFIFLAPLFIFFLKEDRFWRLVLGAFIFRWVFGLGTVYFTLEPLTWLLSSLIFLGLAVSVFLLKKIYKHLLPEISNYALIFSLPFIWTLFDHLEARYSLLPAYIMTAGNIFGSSPFVGLSAIGGLIFLIFFAASINILVADLILKIKIRELKNSFWHFFIIIFIIFAAWQISNSELQKNSNYYNGLKNSLKISAVSVNDKFNIKDADELASELAESGSDLIIFPEDILNDPSASPRSFDFYGGLAKELNTPLLAAFKTRRDEKKYNSAVLFDKNGEVVDVYDKNRLTFIGEYWPFGGWHPFFYDWLGKNDSKFENYTIFNSQDPYFQGDKKNLSINSRESTLDFAVLICLEIHYPNDLQKYKEMGAKFIINPTSNRWLDLGTKHFLYLADNLKKIESVWLKIPIISSGVKDYAGVILPNGKTYLVNYESDSQNYNVFIGKIKY